MTEYSDRDLLAQAAKAIGLEIGRYDEDPIVLSAGFNIPGTNAWWNPLNDGGDALRLATKLGIPINFCHETGMVSARDPVNGVDYTGYGRYPEECACRAIVLAAASVGRII